VRIKPWPTISQPQLLAVDIKLPALKIEATNGLIDLTNTSSEVVHQYVCGITPYDATHLGHAATYLTFDLINRYLTAQGKRVDFVENITDIDDPLLERANRDQVDWELLAKSQVDLFASDMVALHVKAPRAWVPVTQTMDLVEAALVLIWESGQAYELDGDIYLKITPYLDQLAEIDLTTDSALPIFAERGGDPARPGKDHPLDPLLWRKWREGEPGWSSRFGFGRPGWHIECTVISLHYLLGPDYLQREQGDRDNSASLAPLIEIQGGGSDLIFPHHFMSSIQAQALLHRRFASAFIHSGMIGWQGEKMSKSKGNLVFVSKLIANGVDPMVIRWALMLGHYSQDRMWSDELLAKAAAEVGIVRAALAMSETAPVRGYLDQIAQALAHDLDTASALAALVDWAMVSKGALHSVPKVSEESGLMARSIDSLLGLAL
jgi:L-cysteine:1D-myo-inositol 2-amino-2-deoxy-alpha-D-glucopyranoside ligase